MREIRYELLFTNISSFPQAFKSKLHSVFYIFTIGVEINYEKLQNNNRLYRM